MATGLIGADMATGPAGMVTGAGGNMRVTYQEIVDMNTINNKMSILGLHTPTGIAPYTMLKGFFEQYRFYRHVKTDVLAIQPAQLSLDPLQVGLQAGETIDFREATNPILFKGCHGESLNTVLNAIYDKVADRSSPSTDLDLRDSSADGAYYSMLVDKSFKKFGIQTGFRLRGLHPMVSPTATIEPFGNGPIEASDDSANQALIFNNGDAQGIRGMFNHHDGINSTGTYFLSNGLKSLGWLPTTRQVVGSDDMSTDVPYPDGQWISQKINVLPKCFMGVLIFPPSYGQVKWCYRLIISHTFEFRGLRTAPQSELQIKPANTTSLIGSGLNDPVYTDVYNNWLGQIESSKSVSMNSFDGLDVEYDIKNEGVA